MCLNLKKRLWHTEDWVRLLIILGAVLTVLLLVFFTIGEYFFSKQLKSDVWGHTGDFIAGTTGVLWAFAGVLLIYKTLKLQRTQLEIEKANSNENARDTRIRQFEAIYFELVKRQREILNATQLKHPSGPVLHGHDAFDEMNHETWYATATESKFSKKLGENTDQAGVINHLRTVEQTNLDFSGSYAIARAYFRSLYRTVQYLHSHRAQLEKDQKDPELYISILQSQLTDPELVAIFYNNFSYKNAGRLYRNYNLLDSLDKLKLHRTFGHKHVELWESLFPKSLILPAHLRVEEQS